jgi:hypothetical protein
VNTDKFWQKAHDIHITHYAKHHYSLLTDEEKVETVVDYLSDMMALMSEWYNPPDSTHKK